MSRKVQKRKAPVKQKQSQRQSQNVVVNVVMAKHTARRKPSGKLAQPVIVQPPIRMIQSYGDVMAREPPKPQILGEDIRKLIGETIKSPIGELRQEFLSRVENKPKDRLIPPPLPFDFSTGFEEPPAEVDYVADDRFRRDILPRPRRDDTPEDLSLTEDVFEPRYDGATLDMLIRRDYGLTRTGNPRRQPTATQRNILRSKGYLR